MRAMTRMGLVVVLLGIFIPLIAFPFAQGYNTQVGILSSISQMKVIWGSEAETHENFHIPYKYLVSIGFSLVFAGASMAVCFFKMDEKMRA